MYLCNLWIITNLLSLGEHKAQLA